MTETVAPLESDKPLVAAKARKPGDEKWKSLIRKLDLEPLQTAYLEERWLDQVTYMSSRARDNQRKYRGWRITGLVISLIVPALITLGSTNAIPAPKFAAEVGNATPPLTFIAVILSLIVSICAAVEQFFNYGERWRHYRRVSELLKIEGWSFITLTDPYKKNGNHKKAFERFADRVERVLRADVDEYVLRVSQDTAKTGGPGV
jgi:uncharacterized protein DUF4231